MANDRFRGRPYQTFQRLDSVESEEALRPTVGVTGSPAMSVVVVEHGDVATLVLQIHFVPQDLKGFVRTHIGI